MKKMKLILTSLILALTLTFGGGFGANVYASADDPQGTSGSSKTQPAPDSSIESILWIFSYLFW
jgi:hypothetical protein